VQSPGTSKFATAFTALVATYLIIFLLEVSVFNLRHWTTRFAPHATDALRYESYSVEHISHTVDEHQPWIPSPPSEINISDINHPIRTVFVRPQFTNPDVRVTYVSVRYRDESSFVTHTAHIINGYTPSYYLALGAMGDVMYLTVVIHDASVSIQDVYFNQPLPWRFMWVRVILLTIIVTIIWLWKKFGFSRIRFNPLLAWQRYVEAATVIVFVWLMSLVMIFSTDFGFIPGSDNELEWNPTREQFANINDLMVEALLMRQLNLDIEPHYSLLNATQPYSLAYRLANWVHAPWDHVFFEGQFFSYFGITPVVVLSLPYYLLRGEHLSATMATFIFAALGAMGIYFLWKELTIKFLKDIPYTMFFAGLVAALFGTNLILLVVRALQYEIALASGLMFSVWGLFFILFAMQGDSHMAVRKRYLVCGAVSLALAVGCRPTMIFSSLMVPVLLWPAIRSCWPLSQLRDAAARKSILGAVLALALPYAIIGGALAWYNFARFGSIFEFGASYQLTAENVGVVTHTGLLGNLRRVLDGLFAYFFSSAHMQPRTFPYIQALHVAPIFTGHMPRAATIGMFLLPITWFLPAAYFVRKKSKKAMPVVVGMAALGVFIAILSAVLIGVIARYTVDFYWLIMLASLMCMGLVHREARRLSEGAAKAVRHFAYAAVAVSCFVLFNWGMVGENNFVWASNPVVFRFLSDLFLIV